MKFTVGKLINIHTHMHKLSALSSPKHDKKENIELSRYEQHVFLGDFFSEYEKARIHTDSCHTIQMGQITQTKMSGT